MKRVLLIGIILLVLIGTAFANRMYLSIPKFRGGADVWEVFNVTDGGGEAFRVTDGGGADYNVRT